MKYYQLYLITNLINEKKYVGQTNQQKGYLSRFKEHCKCAEKYDGNISVLHKAIHKYGKENFTVKLLMHNISEDKINFYERLWIEKYNTYYGNHQGYNMTLGGSGTVGYIFTDDSKLKQSNASIHYWENLSKEEYENECKRRSDYWSGKPKSFMHRKHLSESRVKSGIAKGKNNGFYGKQHSDKTKQAIGEKNSKPIGMYDLVTGELLLTFDSTYKAVEYLLTNNKTKNKYAASRISKICRGIDKSAYGYSWKFL